MALSKIQVSSMADNTIHGRRNIIINGAVNIDERNNGSEVVPASNLNAYIIDRFRYNASQASKLKIQQNAQSITPPEGFSNYLGVTVNATHTVASTDNFFLTYFVEGHDSAHLDFGKSTAKTVTLSFYVQSSLTGTFSGSILNSAENRAYPYTYTINTADTWERKTITIAGDTSGTWIGATNGKGLMLTFSLGMGSNFTGTAGQWNGAQDFGATGETVKLVENASAQWKMTGLQLEVGSEVTPFEHAFSFGEELNLCQRYFEKGNIGGSASFITTTVVVGTLLFATTKRANPAVSYPTAFTVYVASSVPSLSGHTTSGTPSIYGFMPRATCSTNHHTKACVLQNGVYIADSEL